MCSEEPKLTERQANDYSDHFCIATFNLNTTTRELIPSFKRCFFGADLRVCGIDRCLAHPFNFDPMVYACCCNTTLCTIDVEILPGMCL